MPSTDASPGAESAAFVLCIEDNETRGQALLLIESLRELGGGLAASPVFAVAPRQGLGVDAATRARLESLAVTYLEAELNTASPEYGSANRLFAAAWAAENCQADTLFVLDSDTLFLGEPEPLGADWDLAVRPVDVKGATTEGPGDPFEAYWVSLCGLAGISIESLPWVETVLDRRRVRASYNGGYAVVRRASGILERAADIFTRSVAAGLRPYAGVEGHQVFASTGAVAPRAGELWGSNQAALAIAAWSTTGRVRELDRRYNVPLHELALPEHWSDEWAGLGPLHVHYHWLLRPGHRELALSTMARLGVPADRLEWIRARAAGIGRGRVAAPARPPVAKVGASRALVIAGMHRSATSLVANLLQQSGLEIGERLTGPGPGNRRGHFEDRDFYRLHEEMLAALGTTALSATDELALPTDDAWEERARTLIARRAELALWGWKDPRTSLFLDFWDELLPDARYLFLYRHPVEVALSLRRRFTDPEVQLDPWVGIRAWEVYNRRLLRFCAEHPGRCFLAQVPALTADLDGFVRRVGEKLALPLDPGEAARVFSAEELSSALAGGAASPDWEELLPQALALYRRLEQVADLPSGGAARAVLEGPAPALDRAQDRGSSALAAFERELRATRLPFAPAGESAARAEARWTAVESWRLGRTLAELAALRKTVAELQRGVEVATDRRDELAATLAKIERSRGHRLVAAGWRLLGRLRPGTRQPAG